MLSKTLQDAFNEQIRHEIQSAYLYLAMAQHCESTNLPGFAHWLTVQWNEELGHAMKIAGFVNDRDGRVVLGAIEKPQTEWASSMAVFSQVLAHEQKVTSLIHQLYALAVKENDYASQVMLHWFIEEQVEEEKDAAAIIEQLKRVGESGSAILMLDHQLGSRGK